MVHVLLGSWGGCVWGGRGGEPVAVHPFSEHLLDILRFGNAFSVAALARTRTRTRNSWDYSIV